MTRKKKKKQYSPIALEQKQHEQKPDDEEPEQQQDNTPFNPSKRKTSTISPAENQPESKMANLNRTNSNNEFIKSDPPSEHSTASKDSCALCINESPSNDETISQHDSDPNNETNVTKKIVFDFTGSDHGNDNNSSMHVDSDEEEKDNDPRIIPSYSLKLPTVADLLSQRDLQQESFSKQTKDDRFTRKGKFAKVVMDSPNNTKNYTLEKERKHKECEINKTLYGSFSNQNGDLPFIDAKELLRATIKHIDKTHIEAFYKTAAGKFIIVLNSDEQKRGYAHEINFREEIQNVSLIFRILPRPNRYRAHNRDEGRGSKDDPNSFCYNVLAYNDFEHSREESFHGVW